MVVAKFKIRRKKDKRYFDVIVYDDRKQLKKEASRFERGEDKDHTGILGVCQPFERIKIDGKKETTMPQVGIIRLYNDIGIGVASHEVLHAAFWLYRLDNKRANFGEHCSNKEEILGHTFSELVMDLTKKMYKKGLWK